MEFYSSSFSSGLVEAGHLIAFIEEERLSRVKKKGFNNGRSWMEKIASTLENRNPSGGECNNRPHHYLHAVAAYAQSGFSDASILVMDGCDEEGNISIGIYSAKDNEIKEVKTYPASYSLGALYSRSSVYCGLADNEYGGQPGKLMGLATYCQINFREEVGFLAVDESSGEIKPGSFGIAGLEEAFKDKFQLGCAKRFSFEYVDVAGYAQYLFEKSVHNLLRFMKTTLPSKNLIISGGCGLNCTMNGKIIRTTDWDKFFVPPLCEDAGNLIGVMLLDEKITLRGPLVYNSYRYNIKGNKRKLNPDTVADWIRQGIPIAWFEGGSEYGPRALGHRSILANAELPWMKYRLNEIKHREYWRPFAPIVLNSYFRLMFAVDPNRSPLYRYMLATERIRADYEYRFPSILAPDGTTRPQVLFDTPENHVLHSFMSNHGIPVLINTSMNDKGEPICETIHDATAFANKAGIPLVIVQGNDLYSID